MLKTFSSKIWTLRLTFWPYFIILWHSLYLVYHFLSLPDSKFGPFSTFWVVLFDSMVILLFAVQILITWGFSKVDFFWSSPRELLHIESTSLLALYVAFVFKLLQKKLRPKTFVVLELWPLYTFAQHEIEQSPSTR